MAPRPRRSSAPCLALLITAACGAAAFGAAACGGDNDPTVTSITSATESASSETNPTNNPSTNDPTNATGTGDDPTGGGTDTGGEPASREVCDRYLECLAVTAPDALPSAQQGFGEDGTCWQGSLAEMQQCIDACTTALQQAHDFHPDEPNCALCDDNDDCPADQTCTGNECRPADCGDFNIDANEVCDDPNYCDDDCLGPAECGPLSGAGCGADESCVYTMGGFQCVPGSGGAGVEESCEEDACAEGLYCLAPTDLCDSMICCVALCDVNGPPCPEGKTCYPLDNFGGNPPPPELQYLGFCY